MFGVKTDPVTHMLESFQLKSSDICCVHSIYITDGHGHSGKEDYDLVVKFVKLVVKFKQSVLIIAMLLF